MAALNDLLNTIFEGKKPALYPHFEAWVKESRRFRAFAARYQTKIRAKLKNAHDEGSLNDVQKELETAFLLLREPQFMVEYEKYAAAKQRSPDFTVTFKTHTPFNVEVRHLRNFGGEETRVMGVICDKVGQMSPTMVNVLWLVADQAPHLPQAMLTLRQLAERQENEFFLNYGFTGAGEFLKHYRHLSGVVVPHAEENGLWLNPLARHSLPPELGKALLRASGN